MIKVFLVEDEVIVRDGIKKNIDWEAHGLEFVGEASDGELAFPMIQERRPDILITDIKMPFMDGLELSRLVKDALPDTKILILSGYDEFEYAKEAINIGITDYLLKPITGAKLLEAVKKTRDLIMEENEKKQMFYLMEQEKLKNEKKDRLQFFNRLVSEMHSASSILEEARKFEIDLLANCYSLILFQIFSDTEELSDKLYEANERVIQWTASIENLIVIDRGIEGFAFILRESSLENMTLRKMEIEKCIQTMMEEYSELSYFGGIGSTIQRLSEFPMSFQTANKAFAYRFFREKNIFFESIGHQQEESKVPYEEKISLSELSTKNMNRRAIDNFLKSGLKREVVGFLDEYFDSFYEQGEKSFIFRQYTTMNLYMEVISMLEEIGFSSKELVELCGEYDQMAHGMNSLKDTKIYLKTVFEAAIELRDEASNKKYHAFLQNAIDFIRENYAHGDMSLNMVAAKVNMSPNHFSSVFSQEMNQTFIEFLTEVRLEKAKELLRGTSMKTAEIAFAVGYNDPHYFSYIFKKNMNCTPREYKTMV